MRRPVEHLYLCRLSCCTVQQLQQLMQLVWYGLRMGCDDPVTESPCSLSHTAAQGQQQSGGLQPSNPRPRQSRLETPLLRSISLLLQNKW